MVRSINGKLTLRANNFAPDYDLNITTYNPHDEVFVWSANVNHPYTKMIQFLNNSYNDKDMEKLTSMNLELLRNYLFARKGYLFKDKEMHNFFSDFNRYLPDPSVTNNPAILNVKNRKLLSDIDREEKRRRDEKK